MQHEKELAAAAQAADAAAAKLAEKEAALAEAAEGAETAEHARTVAIEALQAEHAASLQALKVLGHPSKQCPRHLSSIMTSRMNQDLAWSSRGLQHRRCRTHASRVHPRRQSLTES